MTYPALGTARHGNRPARPWHPLPAREYQAGAGKSSAFISATLLGMSQIDMPRDQLESYFGCSPRPEDFDEYWAKALEALDRHEQESGYSAAYTRAEIPISSADCYELYFTSVGGARIHARLAIPRSADRRPVPALLKFHGYTMNAGAWSRLLPYAAEGFAVAAMDVRGQGGESTDPGISAPATSMTVDDTSPQRRGGMAGPTVRGHIIRGVESGPGALFYRSVYLDTVALARVVASLDEVNEGQLGTFGASQGGALALACAALEPRVRHTVSIYPFLCDFRRSHEMETGGSAYEEIRHYFKRRDPRHEFVDAFFHTLGYIDVQYLAERIRGTVRMLTGLQDEACLPSTQFAAYNRMACEKEVIVYPDFGHDDLPDADDLTLTYFNERFGDGRI